MPLAILCFVSAITSATGARRCDACDRRLSINSSYHGSTDVALSGRGWQQMWSAAASASWNRIVSSPLARCAGFARALARRRAIPLEFDERLREMHFGEWEGRTAADLIVQDAEALTRFWQDPFAHPPSGAEPVRRMQARVLSAWEALVQDDSKHCVLLISHGGPIRVILCHVLRWPVERLLEIHVGHAALYSIRVHTNAEGHLHAELAGAAFR